MDRRNINSHLWGAAIIITDDLPGGVTSIGGLDSGASLRR